MLYGWIEVGASNNLLFSSESNEDIILRTIYDYSKLILGNTNGTNIDAGMYIYGNNVGIQKVPDSNIQLDVIGTGRIKNMFIGYSNQPGLTTINGRTIWKDITKDSSTSMQWDLLNSNESAIYKYNGVERMKITDGLGMTLNDTVYVTQDVFANAYQTTSDQRLKKNIVPSDGFADENVIKQIRVYDYLMNEKPTKGFLAQEIEAVYPNAITCKRGLIPQKHSAIYNVDVPCLEVQGTVDIHGGDEIIVTHGSPIVRNVYKVQEVEMTDSVCRLYLDSYTSLTEDDSTISIEGQIVDDIRTVDMNQILALSTSVVQGLLARIETLEKFVYENK